MLPNSDKVMNTTFWIGVWPGLTKKDLDYTIKALKEIVENLRMKSIKKEQQLRETKYILDSPKKGMLTKINPLPKEKLELPYYPAHQKLKQYFRKESDVKTKKLVKNGRKQSTKLVKLSKALSM